MDEIFPGVRHWTVMHEGIGAPVSSYWVEPAGIVIDPMIPPEGLDAFAAGEQPPRQIVLTSGNHTRHAEQMAEAFGATIRVSPEGAERIAGALTTEPYRDGEEIAPGVRAIHVGVLSGDEYALHLDRDGGALALADGLVHYGGSLGFVPDELLGEDPEAIRAGLMERFRALLDEDFEHLLLAHGDPLVGDGRTALRDFVEA